MSDTMIRRFPGRLISPQSAARTHRPRPRILSRVWLLGLMLSALPPGHCAELDLGSNLGLDLSGFGTLSGAISDQDFTYLRAIDDSGTLNHGSLIGLQLDVQFADAWGLTLQAKAAPSAHDDTAWDPSLTWAFLSWRPTNDLLLRAGKLRLPLMLYSANSDVGTTFEFAHLPTEVYSVSPTTDVVGLSFAKTWLAEEREWTLEGYLGTTHTDWRFYLRDGLPPTLAQGPSYEGLDLNLGGLVLSLRDGENLFRIGAHRADAQLDLGPTWTGYPYITLAPGIGYYQVTDSLPGPGVPTTDIVINYVFTASADISLPADYRLIGELVRRRMTNANLGPDTTAAYVSLLKRIGRWTPYVYWAGIRSHSDVLDLYDAINTNRVPDLLTEASLINATQRLGADMLNAYDQQSVAIGASYSLSPTSKIKIEWQHTRSGEVSSFIDAPSGENSGGHQLNLFSLSYSLTF